MHEPRAMPAHDGNYYAKVNMRRALPSSRRAPRQHVASIVSRRGRSVVSKPVGHGNECGDGDARYHRRFDLNQRADRVARSRCMVRTVFPLPSRRLWHAHSRPIACHCSKPRCPGPSSSAKHYCAPWMGAARRQPRNRSTSRQCHRHRHVAADFGESGQHHPAGHHVAARLPEPAVNENATIHDLLIAARTALVVGRTGEAQEALERAESRRLDRSVPLLQTSTPASESTGDENLAGAACAMAMVTWPAQRGWWIRLWSRRRLDERLIPVDRLPIAFNPDRSYFSRQHIAAIAMS